MILAVHEQQDLSVATEQAAVGDALHGEDVITRPPQAGISQQPRDVLVPHHHDTERRHRQRHPLAQQGSHRALGIVGVAVESAEGWQASLEVVRHTTSGALRLSPCQAREVRHVAARRAALVTLNCAGAKSGPCQGFGWPDIDRQPRLSW